MLALQQRRQHLPHHRHASTPTTTTPATSYNNSIHINNNNNTNCNNPSNTTLPSPLSSQTFSLDTLSQQLSDQQAQQYVDQKLLNDYLESQQTTFNPQIVLGNNASNPFMTGAYDFANPQIRIQQSTPTPQHTAACSPSPMLSTHAATTAGLENWVGNSYNSNMQGSQTLHTPQQSRSERSHQRAPSSSSIGSASYQYVLAHPEPSPQPLGASAPLDVDSSFLFLNSLADPSSRTFPNPTSNHLPTPTHTPTQDSFMNHNNNNNNPTSFNNYAAQADNMDSTMAAHMSMKQALMDQHVPEDDVPGFAHSARHSVSSYGHDSPATPLTQGDDMDFKLPPNGETLHKVDSWLFNQFITYDDDADVRPVPKFERTYTDVAADYSYDPNAIVAQTTSVPSKPSGNALLSPYRNNNTNDIIQRSLQAAQIARSQSPSSSASRGDSPFRRGSPYRQPSNNSYSSPRMAVSTAAAAREQKVAADAAHAMKSQVTAPEDAIKTISPKDALLDYRDADDDSKIPLFPDGGASEYGQQYDGSDRYRNTAAQSGFDTTSQPFRRDNWATPQFSPNFSPAVTGTSQPSSTFAFPTPSVQATIQGLPSNPASQYRSVSQMTFAPEQNPEFPAHLTSMESSCSEAGGDPSSQSSDRTSQPLKKPADSKADSGTYTCTYHGCTQRFESPQKLQKHKREGHRNTANLGIGPSNTAGMTSAALLERNSQAGPHKCERINPTTGKPCNTIFSRPYDLTRHEDTIHNVRKQKVRCALCVEEKTFSRNDALTRHMVSTHAIAPQRKRNPANIFVTASRPSRSRFPREAQAPRRSPRLSGCQNRSSQVVATLG